MFVLEALLLTFMTTPVVLLLYPPKYELASQLMVSMRLSQISLLKMALVMEDQERAERTV